MKTQQWNLDSVKSAAGEIGDLGFQQTILDRGRSAGVTLVKLSCGPMEVDVLPTRGMSIWQVHQGELRFGWNSPIAGPVHPSWVPIEEPSGLGWLDGFDEMLVRCGLQSNGAPQHDDNGILEYPLHGRIGNLPARNVTVSIDNDRGQLQMAGQVDESRFHFCRLRLTTTYTLDLSNPTELRINDRIENHSERPTGIQLLYHCNIGSPVLESGARFVAPVKQLCPRNEHAATGIANWNVFGGPDPAYAEQVYFMQLAADDNGKTTSLLHNAESDRGFSITHDVTRLPCFTLWKNTVGEADGYVTGLEPGLNYPNRRVFEEQHQRVHALEPHDSLEVDLTLGFHSRASEIDRVKQKVSLLAADVVQVESAPRPDWCESP